MESKSKYTICAHSRANINYARMLHTSTTHCITAKNIKNLKTAYYTTAKNRRRAGTPSKAYLKTAYYITVKNLHRAGMPSKAYRKMCTRSDQQNTPYLEAKAVAHKQQQLEHMRIHTPTHTDTHTHTHTESAGSCVSKSPLSNSPSLCLKRHIYMYLSKLRKHAYCTIYTI